MQPLYDLIGRDYGATRRADPGIVRTIERLLGPPEGRRLLDLACGTGNYTSALAQRGGRWTGVDLSERMLSAARAKAAPVRWLRAGVERLPFEDGAFDGALCTLAIHHFERLVEPFREIRRVLRSGRFVLFTSTREQMRTYWLNRYFPEMLARAAQQMPERAAILGALETAGFALDGVEPFAVTPALEDLFLYSGKQRAQLYFDAAFRANVSSFSTLCAPAELERGLRELARDIESGTFARVAAEDDDELGDYMFVVASTRNG